MSTPTTGAVVPGTLIGATSAGALKGRAAASLAKVSARDPVMNPTTAIVLARGILTEVTLLVGLSDVVHRVYERLLASHIPPERRPRHLGMILDGNRRWAEAQGSTSSAGHRESGTPGLALGRLLGAGGNGCSVGNDGSHRERADSREGVVVLPGEDVVQSPSATGGPVDNSTMHHWSIAPRRPPALTREQERSDEPTRPRDLAIPVAAQG